MRIEGLWRIAERKTSCDRRGSTDQSGHLGLGDAELRERLGLACLRNRHERGHPSRESEDFEEIDAAAITRGQSQRVEIEHQGNAGALLAEQEKERLVVLAVVRGGLDEGHRVNRQR